MGSCPDTDIEHQNDIKNPIGRSHPMVIPLSTPLAFSITKMAGTELTCDHLVTLFLTSQKPEQIMEFQHKVPGC